MSILNNSLLLGADAGAAGYQVSRSIRLNASDSAFLSRTPASAGNRKTWTWSGWVKRSALGTAQNVFGNFSSIGIQGAGLRFDATDQLSFFDFSSASPPNWQLLTSAVFRDVSAWFHLVAVLDTANATADNRIRLYINGIEQTVFSTRINPSLNYDGFINNTNLFSIGRGGSYAADYFSGYLADIHFIDGQALTPSSFAETNATTGQWVPKAYTGSYGTNGFKLSFSNNASTTTISQDSSGNNNHWTANNISVTAGAGNDSLVDTPSSAGTDSGLGGQVTGNYCTWNPLKKSSVDTLSNGNLDATLAGSANATFIFGTWGLSSGKWYWEVTVNSTSSVYPGPGITTDLNRAPDLSVLSSADALYLPTGQKRSASDSAYGATFAGGDVIGVALDMNAGTITFYKNGVSQGQAFSGITGTAVPVVLGGLSNTIATNFGQRPFAYTAPSGFKALCDTNLPAPVVAKPNSVFDVALWTGNGSARSITGLNFNPDFVWIKGRSGATDHALYDAVRGATIDLASNSTAAETTQTQGLTAFNSDGFSLGTLAKVNTNTATYAGWAWDAGSSTVTNTQGSITSQVRANASAGFSIVTYTGTGPSNSTVGHGLGVAPELIITKNRDRSIYWIVYTKATGKDAFLRLNTTDASAASSNIWGTAAPTSTVFGGVGSDLSNGYTAGEKIVSYCFAPVAGYSAFGSYTGNGSADGVFVYTGFRPRFVLMKSVTSATNWFMHDALRASGANDAILFSNLSQAEDATYDYIDLLSNGFKLRFTNTDYNTSGQTYIWAAFAESPFQYARAR